MNYYDTPTDKQFNEVKEKATKIWKTFDDEFGYATGKINYFKDWKNIRDNIMSIVAMFDFPNQKKLAKMLSDDTAKAVSDRIRAGGTPDEYNPFLAKLLVKK